jgi:hypothetical protein
MKYPNPTEVRQEARQAWEDQQKQQRSRIEKISDTIDYWIILFVLSFVGLSIPHTWKVFDMITPFFGKLAFVGLEFGLLYRSFRGKIAKQRDEDLPGLLRLLSWLLFISLVIANGGGAFMSVAESQSAIEGLSLGDLWSMWPELPATAQIALLLVLFAAVFIPIGTMVGGEGLADLLLNERNSGSSTDEWDRVKQDIEFIALRDAAIIMDHTPKRANKWAREVLEMDTVVQVSTRPTLSSADTKRATTGHATGSGYTKNMDAKTAVKTYLDEYGDNDLSVRELALEVSNTIGDVKKSTAHAARQEWRAGNNGYGADVQEDMDNNTI